MQANYKQRLRMRFGKEGPARFISHLDLVRSLERALNRARIPLAYSQGFNPRPKMQFADALPLGFTSECEIVDFWLKHELQPQEALTTISAKMAPGIGVKSIKEVNISSPALQTITKSARYSVFLSNELSAEVIKDRVSALLGKPTIPAVRGDKRYDLRPLIDDLDVINNHRASIELSILMALEPGRTGRPDAVLKALEIDPLVVRIHRTEIVLSETKNAD